MKKSTKARFFSKYVVLLAASAALAACSMGSGDPLTEAVEALEQQDYQAARIHLMTAMQDDPSDPQTKYLFAKTQIALGDGEAAMTTLDMLAGNSEYQERIKPLIARAHLFQGKAEEALAIAAEPKGEFADTLHAIKFLALTNLDRRADAKVALVEGLTANPDNIELLQIDGGDKLQYGDIDGAIASAKRVLKLAPKSAEALLFAGRVSMAQHRGKQALGYFTKASEVRPDLVEAEFLRGGVMKDLGDRAGARKSFKSVLAASPRHPWATYLMAEMDFQDGDGAAAFERLQASKANLDAVPPALRLKGILDVQRGAFEQAIGKLNRFLSANPADAQTITTLAEAYANVGDNGAALRTILPLAQSATAPLNSLELAANLAQKANDPIAVSLVERARQLKKNPDLGRIFVAEHAIIGRRWMQAEKTYTELLAGNPQQKVMLLNNAAMVQLNIGKAEKALGFARQAYKMAPADPMVQDTLGWILLQTRTDKKVALELLEKAAAAAPDNGEMHWHLANALAANGRKDEARQLIYKLAVEANDGDKVKLANLLSWI